jgi:uncharacterized RDD family membrane protein YckC
MDEEELEYAGFWVRVGASIIDTILILIFTMPILYSIYGGRLFEVNSGLIAGVADFLISWLLPAVAVVLFWIYRQATPGKMPTVSESSTLAQESRRA